MAHLTGVPPQTRPRLSFEEFLRSPYERAEWVDGEVFEVSPENLEHAGLGGFLHRLLAEFAERRGEGVVLTGFLMKTGPGLPARVPDVLFVAAGRTSRLRDTYLDGPADLVVEVISPESVERDRETKRREYERGGVREFWLVDPLRRHASLLTLDGGRFRAVPAEPDGRLASRILPGFWIRPEWLFAPRRPRLAEVLVDWGLA
jgi:Uma2 family endonuclease